MGGPSQIVQRMYAEDRSYAGRVFQGGLKALGLHDNRIPRIAPTAAVGIVGGIHPSEERIEEHSGLHLANSEREQGTGADAHQRALGSRCRRFGP